MGIYGTSSEADLAMQMLDIHASTRVHVKNETADRAGSNQPVATIEQLGANVSLSVFV